MRKRPASNPNLKAYSNLRQKKLKKPPERPPSRILGDIAAEIQVNLCMAEDVHPHVKETRAKVCKQWFGLYRDSRRERLPYELHPSFRDWQEWETIVLSMLKALAHFEAFWGLPNGRMPDEQDRAESSIIVSAKIEHGLDRSLWDQAFNVLQSAGRVKPGDATLFFKRMEEKLFCAARATSRSHSIEGLSLIQKWVLLNAKPDKFPGLCALDNASLASFHADDNADQAMEAHHMSRKIKRLALVKCKQSSWEWIDSKFTR